MGLRVGVIGTGKLGREHVRVLKGVPEVEFVGCHDIIVTRSREVAAAHGACAFDEVNELLDSVDAVSVVVPTTKHAEVSLHALERGKHVFLEKPIAGSMEDGKKIIGAARERGRILQVGHIERFNGAIAQSIPHIKSPSFIEIHRLAPFSPRGIDVSVVMDLMIHDLDLLFLFLSVEPVEVRAKGSAVFTGEPDIVNARLEYASGCVANLTASRVSLRPMRKVRIFSSSGYVSIDLFEGSVRRCTKGPSFEEAARKLHEYSGDPRGLTTADFLEIEEMTIDGEEPLFTELQSFCRTVLSGGQPSVTGEDGLRALKLAVTIQRMINGQPFC